MPAEKRPEVSVGSMLCSCWGYVGDILDHPGLKGRPWVHVGPSWAHLGPILGPCWAYVGPMLAYVGSMSALCWPMFALVFALCWPHVGLCWSHVDLSLGLCWGYVGDMWSHLCWKTSKMPIFPSRTPPRNQKPGFVLSPTKNCARPSAQNAVKIDDFMTSHTHKHTKHRKLQGLQSVGLVRGSAVGFQRIFGSAGSPNAPRASQSD